MNPILKNILAVIGGWLIGSFVNMGLVELGPMVIPVPDGVDMTTPEGIQAAMTALETKHFIFPFLAHALGTFVGALIAYKFAATRNYLMAMIIGAVFLAGGLGMMYLVPNQPSWFLYLDLLVAYLPMAWIATKVG